MKKMTSVLIAMCIAFLLSSVPIYAAPQVKLIINSEILNPDSPPVVLNDSSLVSLDSLKKLNLRLNWDAKQKSVTVTTKGKKDKLVFKVGEKDAMFGDTKIALETPVQLKNKRVMVPLRLVSEAFQSDIRWDKETNTIVIRSLDKANTYSTLYTGDDLVSARKIAVSLPIIGENKLGNSKELSYLQLYFPEGEVLRFYRVWGNLVSYYEVKNDVSYLVWEGVYSLTQPNTYIKENGTRPEPEKAEVYFEHARDSNDVAYGRSKSGVVLKGEANGSGEDTLPGMILPIPNEKRIDKMTLY